MNHIEYRIIVGIGTWYCRKRGIEQSPGLRSAREFLDQGVTANLQEAMAYAFTRWWRILAGILAIFIIFGLIYDGFFFTRTSRVPTVIMAVLIAPGFGSLALVGGFMQIRLRFLGNSIAREDDPPPPRVVPKFYDFWVAVAVTVFFLIAIATSPLPVN
ncbi:MAG TPA: hypothetical protein VJ914_08360 [Pseudonocardiaceae bacterium]|nr:hypothetical protein [Pseudonocardiaceae bacterium]